MKKAIVFLIVVGGLVGWSMAVCAQSGNPAGVAQQFMTASGGSGMEYQYQTKYEIRSKTRDSVLVDTMTTAICDNRCSHVDMDILGAKMTVLGRAEQPGQPKYSVILYPQTRKYKVNPIDPARINGNGQTYQVTKIGTETVAGYSCVHAKLTISGANKRTIVTEDIWTSGAVPGYAQLKQDMANAQVTLKMMQALEQAGCDGFVVKVSSGSEQIAFQMVLMTAERRNFPASMFVIPAGYTAM